MIKHTRSIWILAILLFSLTACLREYDEHYKSEHRSQEIQVTEEHGDNAPFSSWEILILPDEWVQDRLIADIDSAKTRVWIEIYTWTDKDILDAVLRAHVRGIDVRVVLEPNVFWTPLINKPVFTTLLSKDIPVVYADTMRYKFTHAKFFIIDDAYYISTWNLTRSFFAKNRDIIFRDIDRYHLEYLMLIFQRDFDSLGTQDILETPPALVLSPINSRTKLKNLFLEAKKSIVVYVQNFQDPELLDILDQKKKNIDTQICTADNESNRQTKDQRKFSWKLITKPYLHAKIIFLDETKIFIWSQNLTSNSLDNNREVGIIIQWNTWLFKKLMRLYELDCAR
jgi:cardiolipin synthase